MSQQSKERPDRNSVSRRKLLLGAGAGLGVTLAGVPFLTSSASAASAKDGSWCNPAQGYFPDGGHYGAPRGGVGHAGQDVTNSVGTALYAAAAGKVIRLGEGVLTGRTGNGLVISHGGGVYTYYGHLNAFRVKLNATVSAGQRIGDMGATGNVTGPHLHFETHSGGLGDTSDPVDFLSARGVALSGGWPAIDPGAGGETVKTIQYLMTQRGYELVADGDYGSTSQAAVKKFQKEKGLVDDAQVGPKTWPVLVYTLTGGDGNHVKGLQVALNKHSAGLRVDGDFGSVTEEAVRAYQGVNRLVVDGEAGPKTWEALVG
ncbi:peptidoglycan-binding protein [Streptomyces oceani]|uniref:Metalloendopeptidase n=1 Tax=Streptomyces oceani TaxID=1075402 RepID=A0A1E7KJ71_9ACTN|nr:peptidoglycan-binding protein [Streptomyces oceani]OEV03897.1 metalloendopeptidase [Streptomyces oceani]